MSHDPIIYFIRGDRIFYPAEDKNYTGRYYARCLFDVSGKRTSIHSHVVIRFLSGLGRRPELVAMANSAHSKQHTSLPAWRLWPMISQRFQSLPAEFIASFRS